MWQIFEQAPDARQLLQSNGGLRMLREMKAQVYARADSVCRREMEGENRKEGKKARNCTALTNCGCQRGSHKATPDNDYIFDLLCNGRGRVGPTKDHPLHPEQILKFKKYILQLRCTSSFTSVLNAVVSAVVTVPIWIAKIWPNCPPLLKKIITISLARGRAFR